MVRTRIAAFGLAFVGLGVVAGLARADEHADVDRLLTGRLFTDAVQKADQFLASHPRDARMRFLKGLALSEQDKTTDAIAVFVKLTEDFPELPEPYNNLAVLYGKQGQYEQARRSLESAIRTNPSYATAYENLGDVYAKLASQAYSKALQIDGTSTAKVSPKLAMIHDLFAPKSSVLATASPKPPAPTPAPAPKPAAPVVVAAAQKPAAPSPAPAPVATPAAKPADKPAAKPADKPADKPIAQPASDSALKDAQAAVTAWAAAWARQDMDAYLAAYVPDYSAGKSRKAWEAERRVRIEGKKNITVELEDVEAQQSGKVVVVKFRQNYSADTLKVTSRKTLEMVNVSGRWLIQKESTGS